MGLLNFYQDDGRSSTSYNNYRYVDVKEIKFCYEEKLLLVTLTESVRVCVCVCLQINPE
jgi:hypothetical protein